MVDRYFPGRFGVSFCASAGSATAVDAESMIIAAKTERIASKRPFFPTLRPAG